MSDVKHFLRKLDFSTATTEALTHLQKMISYDAAHQLIKEIAEEFIFFETDRRGLRRQKVTPVKELQMLERICNYFSSHGNDQRAALFLYLFPPNSKILEKRLQVLTRLVSMAISISNGNILTCVGIFMQHVGCSSEPSLAIAKTVLKDYSGMISSWSTNAILKNLSCVAPLFCASLIIAITQLYSKPSHDILEMFLEWIVTSPTVCFIPLNLVTTYNCRPQTPLPGLLQWCVLESVSNDTHLLQPNNKIDGNKSSKNIYSSLHLAVLKSMIKISQMKCNLPIHEVMPSSNIIHILEKLKEKLRNASLQPQQIEVALDRFSQALQLSLSTQCLQISQIKANGLCEKTKELPNNRLLLIVMKKWGILLTD